MRDGVYLAKAEWDADVERAMAGATGENAAYTVQDLREEVRAGATALRRVVVVAGGQGRTLGFVCLWGSRQNGGAEMVLQAGASFLSEKDAMKLAMPALRRIARENGYGSIRAHVATDGRRRLLERHGFARVETVMRLEV